MGKPRRKCKICGQWIENPEDSVPYKQGYAHSNCFNVAMKVVTQEKDEKLRTAAPKRTVAPKKQKELKEGLSEAEYKEKVALCDYIRTNIHEDLSPKIYKLMEDYGKKYKITHAEMLQDLKWYYEIENHQVEGDMIGIIPYIHQEAQRYYRRTRDLQQSCQEKIDELQEMYKETKITANKGKRKVKQISMDDLLQEETS